MFTQHVTEHIAYAEAVSVLKECFRTLKPGAWIRIWFRIPGDLCQILRHEIDDDQFFPLPHPTLALSFLTSKRLRHTPILRGSASS
jgi:predicted SAM-dependent methyltransferase